MQTGFFDVDERLALFERLGDPLTMLKRSIEWEHFRSLLSKIHDKERKSNAGRKPYDVVLMFKVLVLQHLYNNLYGRADRISNTYLGRLHNA